MLGVLVWSITISAAPGRSSRLWLLLSYWRSLLHKPFMQCIATTGLVEWLKSGPWYFLSFVFSPQFHEESGIYTTTSTCHPGFFYFYFILLVVGNQELLENETDCQNVFYLDFCISLSREWKCESWFLGVFGKERMEGEWTMVPNLLSEHYNPFSLPIQLNI